MKKNFNKISVFFIFFILLITILFIHTNILFAPVDKYFQFADKGDLHYYINLRQYAFNIIKNCLFPLWTTKLFCGTPFFANSETAIFYLPNVIFFFLPISKAVNFSFLLHFFILSFSTFLWINNRIKDKLISIIVAIIAVFNSNYYLHFYAAHLSNITTVSWFPLLLYFYDKTFEKKKYINIFPITFIISLQIFAGHFQYVYYTALISLIYILLFCRNKHTIITISCAYCFAFFLTAIQILPSYDFYLEGARKANIFDTGNFSIFSELKHLITLIFHQNIYFTSITYWETSNYIGTLNIFVVLISLLYIRNKNILKTFILIIILYSLTFENVSNFMQHIIPCFSWFRSPVKLIFFANIFLMLLLAYGIKFIICKKSKTNIFFILFLLLFSIIVFHYKEVLCNLIVPNNFPKKDLENMILSFKITIFLFLSFSILLYLKKYLISRIIIIILLIIEPIIVMKLYSRPFIFKNNYKYSYMLKTSLNEQTRFYSYDRYNLSYNTENVVGKASDKLKNFLIFNQKNQNNNIKSLLRLKYMINDYSGAVTEENIKTLNRINIFYNYIVETDKGKIYKNLYNKKIDIFDTVILEKEPQFKSQTKGNYKINIIAFNENSIDFECNTTEPAIILYTDNYAKGWKAYNIENPTEKYEIICADYIYKAISVDKGNHKIRFEYKPLSFTTGMWISIVSWIIFIIFYLIITKKKFTL